jgi:amidohydrolase
MRLAIMLVIACFFQSAILGQSNVHREKASAEAIQSWMDIHQKELLDNYFWLHANPEVSFEEKQTAEYLAKIWKEGGFTVTENVGGFGIVGVLTNGKGPTVMLRTDLDALPVKEDTGLPYASKKEVITQSGTKSGVMHACAHDLHMTCVTGAGLYLAEHRDLWRGTLMLIGQPAEERGSGAKAMLDDGLFTRFAKPDFAIALHVESATPAGSIGVRSGFILANVDSVDIEVKGKGGHGASPDTTIDPIVQAAELVLSLQTIVSREIKPTEPAVVTVGAINGGSKHNIIGDRCHLQITVRSYSDSVRSKILASIERRAKAIAQAYDAPTPEIKISEGTPALANNPELTERLRKVYIRGIGNEKVLEAEQVMGGEDFSQYGLAGVPILMYRLGVIAPETLDRYKKLSVTPPSLHSPQFYPELEASLPTGVITLSLSALELMPAD